MINVQAAVTSTLNYIQQFEKVLPIANVRLEEFEYIDERTRWLITLSFEQPSSGIAISLPPRRDYKTFVVDANDGQVIAMRIRNPMAPPPSS